MLVKKITQQKVMDKNGKSHWKRQWEREKERERAKWMPMRYFRIPQIESFLNQNSIKDA